MSVLWTTLLIVAVLGYFSQTNDYQLGDEITYCKVSHTRQAKFFFCLVVIVLIFVAGNRYYVGSDFKSYYHGYEYYSSDLWRRLVKLDEPVISIIYKIATAIWHDGWAGILATAAFTIVLSLNYIYRNTDCILLALVLYVFIVFGSCFNAVRQTMAMAICCCAFPYLRDKKPKQYFLIIFIAFLCHKSAILMLGVYFVCHRKITLKHVLILTIVSIIVLNSYDRVYMLAGSILDEEISLENEYWTNEVRPLSVIVECVPFLFFEILLSGHEKTEEEDFYLNLLLINLLVSVITMNSTCLARMRIYTNPYLVIALPELLKKTRPIDRKIVTLTMVVLYGVVWWYSSRDLTWLWLWQRSHVV